MPSLRALEEFKASFKDLGLETQTLKELDLPFDDLPLPENEPEPDPAFAVPSDDSPSQDLSEPDFSSQDFSSQDLSEPDADLFGDLSDLLGGGGELSATDIQAGEDFEEPAPSSQEDIDFGNFIDTIPDDFAPDSPRDESGVVPLEEPLDESIDDGGTPPGLLNGFADEIETERALSGDTEDFTGGDAFDLGDLDFSISEPEAGGLEPSEPGLDEQEFNEPAIPDFAIPDLVMPEPAMPGPADEPADELVPDLGMDDFLPDQGLETFPDFNAGESLELGGEETFGGTAAAVEEVTVPDLGSPDLGSVDLEEGVSADLPEDDDSFDYKGEAQDLETEAELEEISGDAFDNFSPDSASLAGDFDLGDGGSFGSLDDFSIPGLSFDEKSPGAGVSRTGAGRGLAYEEADVEEIELSTEELSQFLETLGSYPLNLRIACGELIAEQAVAPDQMSKLVNLLIDGAPASEAAALAGKILDKTIPLPKGYEKKTGEELEAEQSSFAYIFVHNFLPVLRLFMGIALVVLSAGYLSWRYVYTPMRAERIYKLGIERIDAGEYSRANERFLEAFLIHPKISWFFTYARAFRDSRQYTLSEEKYQQLLNYTASKNKRFIPDKAAVLEYADLKTNYMGDYEAADRIIRRNILDYYPMDREGLLALGDNSLLWGEYEKERLEDAREAYARLIERYGRSDPLMERMLKYFIRVDNLEQVLPLQSYFMGSSKRKISASALAEMAGYFLDKRFEKVTGVPNEYLEYIGGIREILLKAIQQDPMLPESYYHLARYYNYFENINDEKTTLEVSIRAFESAREDSPKRIGFHINALRRYAEILIQQKEFFPAEENLLKGINIYQDALSRRILNSSPEFGRLYANLGDLEFFVKAGDMRNALDYYGLAEQSGWAPPELQYRMGAAHYQLRQWGPALERLFAAHREETRPNRRILYALGNVSYMRGNYFAAQGYYERLLEILDDDRSRLPLIMATDDEKQLDLAERLMVAQNNLGVTLEALSERTGNTSYRSRAQGLFADSERAWDVLTRNPLTMNRMRPTETIGAPSVNPAYLNIQNSLRPVPGFESHFFLRIDKDMLEPSQWENIAPPGYNLSQGIHTGR